MGWDRGREGRAEAIPMPTYRYYMHLLEFVAISTRWLVTQKRNHLTINIELNSKSI